MSENKKQTSQSIYVTLDTLTTETSVPGQTPKMQSHTLPRAAFPTSEQFEHADQLEAWAKETGFMHACLQKGVQKHLIDCRAAFKACKKADTWSNEYGQSNVDAYEWTVVTRPAVKADKQAIQAEANTTAGVTLVNVLKAQGMDINAIKAMVTSCYPGEVDQILERSATLPE